MIEPTSMAERLAGNRYELDEELSHIEVDQEAVRRTGFGPVLVRICPAGVYSQDADGRIAVAYAACLECGTCLALAPDGVLTWHYPRGGFGVVFREG
ncbi:MAG: 4Fe-4S dicluster domain-containing protein [Actinobacteria bacterium]|nr:4Fe-4S dicluster domain-containing protein [Actinomycetota bacterium]MCG2801033.1 4Fe-4S dicluster domain-containing protein [Cellulomonas sp.]